MTKKEFTRKVLYWLAHKKALSNKSEHYKKPHVIISMGKLYDIYKLVSKDCSNFSMPLICSMIRMNEEHMRNVLPVMTNPSYTGELEKLETILTIANSYKK